jgi:hypothetical protein
MKFAGIGRSAAAVNDALRDHGAHLRPRRDSTDNRQMSIGSKLNLRRRRVPGEPGRSPHVCDERSEVPKSSRTLKLPSPSIIKTQVS